MAPFYIYKHLPPKALRQVNGLCGPPREEPPFSTSLTWEENAQDVGSDHRLSSRIDKLGVRIDCDLNDAPHANGTPTHGGQRGLPHLFPAQHVVILGYGRDNALRSPKTASGCVMTMPDVLCVVLTQRTMASWLRWRARLLSVARAVLRASGPS
ncbi:hypothetical protein CIHG_07493 [Coccidioides immitis H538.4]|uniref:Uncharacterized protein n=1 Tax=Coccidioides immitis H538.4 TaxID=396776 RepID=A0A0J8RYM7_COCIT|nr:hypothetical protein CIHG_07493 [Coccidioides immitis H538.4]